MAAYSLTFKPSVEKDFFKIPQPVSSRILTRIEQLPANPFPPQTSRLQGAERLYRLRVGDYRVVYEVDPEVRAIIVHYVRHRRDVYRALR